MADSTGLGFGLDLNKTSANSVQQGTQRTVSQKYISDTGINKLIYDALSADNGLASLATGENLSGGYGASTKALLGQDFMVKLIGELANVSAQTVTDTTGTTTKSESGSSSKASGGLKLTVICTELHSQGLLSAALYNHPAASVHLSTVHPYTLAGYHLWAVKVVSWMKKSPLLSHLLLPICQSRYEMVTSGKFKFWGAATIYIGHPICFILGALSNLGASYAIAS